MDATEKIARLELIKFVDPVWGTQIESFLQTNPLFQKYSNILPMTRYPMGFGKNIGEPIDSSMPKSDLVIEHLIYYICCSGVNYKYGLKQWHLISTALRNTDYDLTMAITILDSTDSKIQPGKRQVYLDLVNYLEQNYIHPLELDLSLILKPNFKIKGIGLGAVIHIKSLFGDSTDLVAYTDRKFIKGFMKIYQLDKKPTKTQIVKITQSWGKYKNVGNAICFQVCHYG